ncbi:hypothetical protein [Phaeobacter gallaeciensis]|uniref:hypothetical protein n=1 Tax=Phaeobacter gallaeciensis TaxID=60890 RepID=UPI000BBC7216|nr:hypothetical protein [Phaeobacter gallaeciensis]ATF18235.1 hypothetical protein PhaeoP129_01601 [Phaeobacter gallaeciensis]ATF22344.1 hypothetical protein PhaeoP128_01601 [Phaeobacter gallaeciensis]
MSDNKSIAFWCERAAADAAVQTEFHVNLWHFSGTKRRDFIEIGVMPSDASALSAIRIFVPFPLQREDIQDLGPEFASTELAQGIFNETLSSTKKPNGKSVELKVGANNYCHVHLFSPEDGSIDPCELNVVEKDGGTLISITSMALGSLARQSNGNPESGYFRLRLLPPKHDTRPFVTAIKPKDRAWTSGFEEIEYIDCRLNEARTLPTSVEASADAAQHGLADVSRIVFLAVVPVASSITSSHAEWHKSRLLETQIWKDYVPHGLEDGMVVYHWRKKFEDRGQNALQGFSAFVKLQTRKTSLMVIGIYVLVALALGVVGSLTASAVQWWVSGAGGS